MKYISKLQPLVTKISTFYPFVKKIIPHQISNFNALEACILHIICSLVVGSIQGTEKWVNKTAKPFQGLDTNNYKHHHQIITYIYDSNWLKEDVNFRKQ